MFWAKSGKPGLSLLAHSLDTAAVAYDIMSRMPEPERDFLCQSFGLPEKETKLLVAFLCGIHDLGKASPIFQGLWLPGRSRLEKAGFPFPPSRYLDGPRHPAFTEVFAKELLPKCGFSKKFAERASFCLACHHGFAPTLKEQQLARNPRRQGKEAWHKARFSLLRRIFEALRAGHPGVESISPDGAAILMGLTTVSDWIASDVSFFPYGRKVEKASDFWEESKVLASKALNALNWRPQLNSFHKIPEFENLFPFHPNELQQAVIDSLSDVEQPAFLLIEAPMGGGKTEAALFSHLKLSCLTQHRGFYIAMPTQATGNAMFVRIRRFLAGLTKDVPIELQLQHGTALLNPEYTEIRQVGEESSEMVQASEWFSQKRRAMLSPFGVGTVDQALLGVLRVKHHFVRLFGLCNRTVILDEVHAYDAYTSGLIEALIKWLRSLGSSVIVMSATLSSCQRRRLLDAAGGGSAIANVSYPRVTVVSDKKASVRGFGWPSKELSLAAAPVDIHSLAQFAGSLLEQGGEGAVVLNTVDRAQRLYDAFGSGKLLKDQEGRVVGKNVSGMDIFLFHARFPSNERLARERAVLSRFGKNSLNGKRGLLIATQVMEQSLDIDFDVMVSDLAPIDLLLQRMGRLHRHKKMRPEQYKAPICYVSGLDSKQPPDIDGPGWARIYYPFLLLSTWWILRHRNKLRIPSDLEPLINAVYDQGVPSDLDQEFLAGFETAYLAMTEDIEDRRSRAIQAGLLEQERLFERIGPDIISSLRLDDEEESPFFNVPLTRLGGPSVTVLPLFEDSGTLFLDKSLSIPVRLEKRLPKSEAARLFSHTVRVSTRGLAESLMAQDAPWSHTPLISRVRPLAMDKNGTAALGGFRVELSSELGLVIHKQQGG